MSWRIPLLVALALSLALAFISAGRAYELRLNGVREALVGGQIEDALAYYERSARAAEKDADRDMGQQMLAAQA